MGKKFMAEDYSRRLFLPTVFWFLLWTHFTSKFAVTLQWQIQGRGPGGPPPPYFRTKLRPEGPKKFFLETSPPPVSKGLVDRPPPPSILSQGIDPALLWP